MRASSAPLASPDSRARRETGRIDVQFQYQPTLIRRLQCRRSSPPVGWTLIARTGRLLPQRGRADAERKCDCCKCQRTGNFAQFRSDERPRKLPALTHSLGALDRVGAPMCGKGGRLRFQPCPLRGRSERRFFGQQLAFLRRGEPLLRLAQRPGLLLELVLECRARLSLFAFALQRR